jgi:hypothetical protein
MHMIVAKIMSISSFPSVKHNEIDIAEINLTTELMDVQTALRPKASAR